MDTELKPYSDFDYFEINCEVVHQKCKSFSSTSLVLKIKKKKIISSKIQFKISDQIPSSVLSYEVLNFLIKLTHTATTTNAYII